MTLGRKIPVGAIPARHGGSSRYPVISMRLEISPLDQVLTRFGNGLAMADKKAPTIMAMALNKKGRDGRVRIRKTLQGQTGLKASAVNKALQEVKASSSTLTWKLIGRGDFIPLKYFSPREIKGGVKHTSPKDPNPFPNAFTKVGGFISKKGKGRVFRMGARKATDRFGGHVMINTSGGKWGGSVEKVKSKVSIPIAMVEGQTRATFERIGPEVVDEVGRLLGGFLDGSIAVNSRAKPR